MTNPLLGVTYRGVSAMKVAIELIYNFSTHPKDRSLSEVTLKRLCTIFLAKTKLPQQQQTLSI
jgi:hypothetical protein